ncbi:phosphotransferase enzyme family protein [Bacillus sp. AK128]
MIIINNAIQTKLCQSYGLPPSVVINLLNDGENQTFITELNEIVIRKYRTNRFSKQQIQAEIAWLKVLGGDFLVPNIILNSDNEEVTSIISENKELHFTAFQFITGEEITDPGQSDYEKLGGIMYQLHQKSNQIIKETPKTWVGFQRPIFDEKLVIHDSLENLCNASFLTTTQKDLSIKIAEKIQKLLPGLGELQFIHSDLHFGNILQSHTEWHILDFDECGFGYQSFDLAVPRMFLLASNQLHNNWNSFKNGYNHTPSETAIRTGTAMRIFYMTGKIPNRLDIEHIGKNPSRFVDRYLQLIEEELSGETLV